VGFEGFSEIESGDVFCVGGEAQQGFGIGVVDAEEFFVDAGFGAVDCFVEPRGCGLFFEMIVAVDLFECGAGEGIHGHGAALMDNRGGFEGFEVGGIVGPRCACWHP